MTDVNNSTPGPRSWTFNFQGTPQQCIDALNALNKNVDMPDHVIDGQIYLIQYTLNHQPPFTIYKITSSGQWGGTVPGFGHVSQSMNIVHSYR